jgi:hypothetical protein
LCAAAACLLLVQVAAFSQDFQKTYRLGAGGSVSVSNVSGDVNVAGYDGDAVTVSAFKEGRDRELVEVEDLSTAGGIRLRASYPRHCDCDASIRFEVKVPRSLRLNFEKISTASGNISVKDVNGQLGVSTASGDVTVEGVSGEIRASTASGNVRVREVAGTVNASSASGDVDVEIARLEGTGGMKFSTASGDVSVRLPSSLDADVHMSTVSGSVKTNFPLEVKERDYGPGSTAKGRLGSGSRTLRISSASGNVSLTSL